MNVNKKKNELIWLEILMVLGMIVDCLIYETSGFEDTIVFGVLEVWIAQILLIIHLVRRDSR